MTEQNVIVIPKQCFAVAETLMKLEIRPGFIKRPFITHPLNRETRLGMLFFSVAICHQTHELLSRKSGLTGWDYIEEVFLRLAIANSGLLNVNLLAGADHESVEYGLEAAFSDTGNPIDSSLDRIGERVRLYMDLNAFIHKSFDGSFGKLLDEADGYLFNKGKGLYELLGKTEAFSDAMRKKSSFLIKLLIDSELFQIRDAENYVPIMDYHMQRVLLRLGCISIVDQELLESIRNRKLLGSDLPVRKACIDAVNLLSVYSGIEVWKMNDLFWSLGRSCCNETLLCLDKACAKEPCTFQTIILLPEHTQCSFEAVCNGFAKEATRSLWEPLVETHYY